MTDRLFEAYEGVVNVKDYGALGNGGDDTAAIAAAVVAAVGSPSHGGLVTPGSGTVLNKRLYFPPGYYRTGTINLTGVSGLLIQGAGRFATVIENQGGTVFNCDGVQYTRWTDMCIVAGNHGSCVILDLTAAGVALSCANQSNTFLNVFFGSFGGSHADYGLKIAPTGGAAMGSETSIFNCYFLSFDQAAIITLGGNALQTQVVGGNIGSCNVGCWAAVGSIPLISGVGFQANGVDIRTDGNQGPDAMTVEACRSESDNFCFNNGGQYMSINNCGMTGSNDGYFLKQMGGYATIQGSYALNGKLSCWYWGNIEVTGMVFGRVDWYEDPTGNTWGGQGLGDYTASQSGMCIVAKQIRAGGWNVVHGQPALQEVHVRIDASNIVRRFDYELSSIAAGNGAVASPGVTVTATIASPGVITLPQAHGFYLNMPVMLTTTGALPTGYTASTMYFVKTMPSASTITLSATPGGAAINTTGSQSGVHTLYIGRHWTAGDRIRNSAPSAGNPPGWVCTTSGYNVSTAGAAAAFLPEPNL